MPGRRDLVGVRRGGDLRRLAPQYGTAGLIPICPEELGGLPTPRAPCEITRGTGADVLSGLARVIDAEGRDRTESFLRGAEEAARIARSSGAVRAVLKSKSPSCDAERGVTAAMLARAGVEIESAG
jgi:uncharacterized protein YbbK (DUF523 family)